MSRSPKPKIGTTVFLYILGIAFLVTGAIVLLQGLGVLSGIPSYVIWSLILLTVGIAIIAGIKTMTGD